MSGKKRKVSSSIKFCTKRGKLCGSADCPTCFPRCMASFAHLESFAVANPDANPLLVLISEKVKWHCSICKHCWEASGSSRKNMSSGCPICSGTSLCGDPTCMKCFDKSLAAADARIVKAFCAANPDLNPHEIFMHCNTKFDWQCDKDECMHVFRKSCNKVNQKTKPQWCTFCAGKELCRDRNCVLCKERSIASSPHVNAFQVANPTLDPYSIFISTAVKFDWKCEDCPHTFSASPATVNRGHWCPFCSHSELCGNEACLFCLPNCLASSPRADSFKAANTELNVYKIFLSMHDKVNWKCFDCLHTFPASPANVKSLRWCPYCSGKKLCGARDCDHCRVRSIAGSPHLEEFQVTNPGLDPFKIPIGGQVEFDWKCKKCEHVFNADCAHVNSGTWCPYCAHKKMCGNVGCVTCPLPCSLCEKRSFCTLRSGARVCYSDYINSGEAVRANVRLEIFALADLQRLALARNLFEFQEPTSWDCAILPGLAFRPDMLWAFDAAGNVFATAGACKINLGLIHHIVILEIVEIGLEQHSAARTVTDEAREEAIRGSLQGVIVDFVYTVVAAYNHPTAHPDDKFFTKSKTTGTYHVQNSRRAAWNARIDETLDALSSARSNALQPLYVGSTVFIGR